MNFFDNNRRNYILAAAITAITGVAVSMPRLSRADLLQDVMNSKAVDAIEHALRLDRKMLSRDIVTEETNRGNREKLRVRLNETLVIIRETEPKEAEHKVDGDGIEEIIVQDRRIQTIRPKAKGMIIDAEGDGTSRNATLWVAFSNECASRDCAFRFEAVGNHYQVAGVPEDLSYQHVSLYARTFGLVRESLEKPNNLRGLLNRGLHLTVDKDTITQINTEREKIEGVE